VRDVAAAAEAEGFFTHWGKKVLEVRPPVPLDKGRGIQRLLRDTDLDRALYVGDDRTDLDAFRGLTEEVAAGRLQEVLRVGVRSDETPEELEAQADLLVDGPPGVRDLLLALL
jgi:trehalose 6-phosphate phosphatase